MQARASRDWRPAGVPRWWEGRALSQEVRALAPGFVLSAVVAMAAAFAATVQAGPLFPYALFFGIASHHLARDGGVRPGLDFCARSVLRLGVALLGARITADQIAALGWTTAATVVLAVASTIGGGAWLARRFGMSTAQGLLSGGAVGICGASAALAISAVLPRERGSERFTLMVVLSVTVLSTAAMVLYPLLARALGLPPERAGVFIGANIHDVAQVVGAGYTLGQEAGDIAVVVKLFRVSMLSVVVAALSLGFRTARRPEAGVKEGARPPLVPWFLWVFVMLVAANSFGWLAGRARAGLAEVSQACLVLAIAALGVKTSLRELAQAGWRPFVLLLSETLWIGGVVLTALLLRA